ncbi:MAG: kelch repeat-containing protein, partial [Thermoplasmata archaeon]
MKKLLAILIVLVLCFHLPQGENAEGAKAGNGNIENTTGANSIEPAVAWSLPFQLSGNVTAGPVIKTDGSKYHAVWVENNTTLCYANFTSATNLNKIVLVNSPLPVIALDYGLSNCWHLIAYTLANYSTYVYYSKTSTYSWQTAYIGYGINPSVYVNCTGIESEETAYATARIGLQNLTELSVYPNQNQFLLENAEVSGDGIMLAKHPLALLSGLYYIQTVAYCNSIYIFGGTEDGIHGKREIYRFDTSTMKIEVVGFLPYPVFGHVAFAYGDAVYIAGGCTELGNCTDGIVRFWLQNYTIEMLPLKLPQPMAFGAAAVHQGSAIIPFDAVWILPGGIDQFWRFRFDTMSIEVKPRIWEIPTNYSHMGAVMNGDCLFIFGGLSGEQFVNKTYKIWMHDGMSYIESKALPFGVADMGYYMAGNTLYIFGGRTPHGITDKIIECYFQPWSYPWEEPKIVGVLEEPVFGLSACRIREGVDVYLFGGVDEFGAKDAVYYYKIVDYRRGNMLYSTGFESVDGWYLNVSEANVVEITRGKLHIDTRANRSGYGYAESPSFLPPVGIAEFEFSIDFMLPYYDNQMFWLLKGADWGIGVERNYSRSDEYGSMMYADSSGNYSFITYIWRNQWHNLRVVYSVPYFYVFLDNVYCGMYYRPEVLTAKIRIGDIEGNPADAYGAGYFDNFTVYSVSAVKWSVLERIYVYYEEGSCEYHFAGQVFPITFTPHWYGTGTISTTVSYENEFARIEKGQVYNFTTETTEFSVRFVLRSESPVSSPVLQNFHFFLTAFDSFAVYEWNEVWHYDFRLKKWVWELDGNPTWVNLGYGDEKIVGKAKFVDGNLYCSVKTMLMKASRILCYEKTESWMLSKEIATLSGSPYYGFDVATFGKQIWVVYADNETGFYQLYMKYSRDAGENWDTKRITFGCGNAKEPKIGLDTRKNVHVIYLSNENYYWNVNYLKYDSFGRNVALWQKVTDVHEGEIYGYYSDGTPYAGYTSIGLCTDLSGNPRLLMKSAEGIVRYADRVPEATEQVETAQTTLLALPDTAFSGNATQQKNTLDNKYEAVANML